MFLCEVTDFKNIAKTRLDKDSHMQNNYLENLCQVYA